MMALKLLNLLLQLLVCWQIRRYYYGPWAFPQWRRSWGLMGAAMAVLVLRRLYAFWDEQAWIDVLLSSCASLGMYLGFTALFEILTTPLPAVPDPPVAHITADSLSQIVAWDAEAEQLFGWTAADALGKTLLQTIIAPQDWESHRQGLARYLAQVPEARKLRGTYAFMARRKDGSEIPVSMTLINTPTPEGTVQFHAVMHALVPL